ncbi:hypothetical protein HK405_007721, partial [Cladochytrium tenue]
MFKEMARTPSAPAEDAPVCDVGAPLRPATSTISNSTDEDNRRGPVVGIANEPQAASLKSSPEEQFRFCASPSIDSDDDIDDDDGGSGSGGAHVAAKAAEEFPVLAVAEQSSQPGSQHRTSTKQHGQAVPATQPSPGGFAQSTINEARALAALAAAVVLRLVGSRWRMVQVKLQRAESADSANPVNYHCGASFSDRAANYAARQENSGGWVPTPATPVSAGPVSSEGSSFGGGGGAITLLGPGCDARAYAALPSPASTLPSRSHSSVSAAMAPWRTLSDEPGSVKSPTAAAGGLPGGFETYYMARLGRLVTLALLKTPTPPQVVPVALSLVRRLAAQAALPRSLATPTRLLLAALVLADATLSDMPVPARVWDEVAGACGIIKDDEGCCGGLTAKLKGDALALLGFELHVSPNEFHAWLVALECFVATVCAAPQPTLPAQRAALFSDASGAGSSVEASSAYSFRMSYSASSRLTSAPAVIF